MAIIGKIREKSWLLVGVIGVALVSFILGDFLSGSNRGQNSMGIGTVYDSDVDYAEYDKNVSLFLNDAKATAQKEQRDITQQEQDQAYDQAWSYTVDNRILQKEYDALGINVSEAEFKAYLLGKDGFEVLPDIAKGFTDSVTGAVNTKLLESKIKEGSFRQDLFHRINVFPITIPPLRDRKEDIIPTAMVILKNLKKKHQISVNFLSSDAMKKLVAYDWPGNVREMENTLERIVLINDKPIIGGEEIESILEENGTTNVDKELSVVEKEINKDSNISIDQNFKEENLDIEDIPFDKKKPITLKELERIAILAGLDRTNWNMSTTAQQLGISRMTLYRKLTQHNLDKNG